MHSLHHSPIYVYRKSRHRCWLIVGVLGAILQTAVMGQEPSSQSASTKGVDPTARVIKHKNLFYGSQTDRDPSRSATSRRYCDVYLPDEPPSKTGTPTVIVIHGGGWVSGDKWTLESYSQKLAATGIAVVSINYRLAPQHKFPSQADDVRQVMVWVKKNAPKYSFDLSKLGMFGYSAGGHLTLLIAALADEPMAEQLAASQWPIDDPRWHQMPNLIAVCAGGPPCNFETLPIDNTTMSYFLGDSRRELPNIYRGASPLAHVSQSDPTTFIIHGDGDVLVPIQGARAFYQEQKEQGVKTSMQEMPGQGHVMTFLNPQTSDRVTRFFWHQFLHEEPLR